jgi:hypothetical protein
VAAVATSMPLARGQVASANTWTSVYTTPANQVTRLTEVGLFNEHVSVTIDVYIRLGGRKYHKVTLAPEQSWPLSMNGDIGTQGGAPTESVELWSSQAACLDYHITGVENVNG